MDKIKPIPATRPYIPEEDIGWILRQTRTPFKEGIRKYIAWYQSRHKKEVAEKIEKIRIVS